MNECQFSVGKSKLFDAKQAGIEVAKQALDSLDSKDAKFALMFATASYDQNALLEGVAEVIGDTPLIGCSGEGIITYGEGSDESGFAVGLMLFQGEGLQINSFLVTGLKEKSTECGDKIAKSVLDHLDQDHGLLLVFADSMTVNTTHLLERFNQQFAGKNILVLGGTAGDMMKFKQTFQYYNHKVYEDSMIAVLIQGDFSFDWMVSHGCQSVGVKQTVTRSHENSLLEVDGKPTWEEFREYLPDKPEDFKAEDAFHLCVGEIYTQGDEKKERLIIRMPVGLNKDTGAVQFSTEIPENTTIHFTRRDPKVIAEKAIASFKKLLEENKGREPIAVFQFDCAGRGRVIYGDDLNNFVIKPLQELMNKSVPWIGFHTYGEIAPLKPDLIPIFFHNFTVVLGVMFK